jgi:hypothetical protein
MDEYRARISAYLDGLGLDHRFRNLRKHKAVEVDLGSRSIRVVPAPDQTGAAPGTRWPN